MLLIIQVIIASGLVISVFIFMLMGFRQFRRSRIMATLAHTEKMRFAYEDPFNIPSCCASLELMQSGHNPRASNVIHGRRNGIDVRGFDFSYETGQGPSRSTRKFYVVLVHSALKWPPAVLLWNKSDSNDDIGNMQGDQGRVGRWLFRGSRDGAIAVLTACQDFADDLEMIEAKGDWLVVASRFNHHPAEVVSLIDKTVTLAKKLCPIANRS